MSDEQFHDAEIEWLTRHSTRTRIGVLAGMFLGTTLELYAAAGFGYGLAPCRLDRAGCLLLVDA